MTLFTAGYQGRNAAAFEAEADRLGAGVIDVRLRPWSPNPDWRAAGLLRRFGRERYLAVTALGNLNYKSGGPILIKDLEAGLEQVLRRAAERPQILLCACRNAESCHRSVVAAALRERGHAISELPV